jgi:outer membrane protein TolC
VFVVIILSADGLVAQDAGAARLGTSQDSLRLSLAEALRMAEPASEQLGIAEAATRRVAGEIMETRSALLPQITLTPQLNRIIETPFNAFFPDTSGTSNPFTAANQWRLGGNVAWTPLNLSQASRVDAAKAARRQADLRFSEEQASTILRVATAYYDAALTDRLVSITEFTLAQAERNLKDVSLGREVGTQSEYEQLRSRVFRDNQIPVVTRTRANRDIAFTRLKQLLDVPLAQPVVLGTPLNDSPTRDVLPVTIDTLLADTDTTSEQRVVVRVADEAVTQSKELLRSAGRQWVPTLGAQMNYNQAGFGTQFLPRENEFYTDWNVVAVLNWNIFTSGRILGGKRQAQANLDAARLSAKLAREQAALDNEVLFARLREAQDNALATASVVEQATRAYEIGLLRYTEGLSTQTELQDVRLQLEQAGANQAQAARDLQIARLRVALLPYLPLGTAENAQMTTSAQSSVGTATQAQQNTAGGANQQP